jgi:hypothetical protein
MLFERRRRSQIDRQEAGVPCDEAPKPLPPSRPMFRRPYQGRHANSTIGPCRVMFGFYAPAQRPSFLLHKPLYRTLV